MVETEDYFDPTSGNDEVYYWVIQEYIAANYPVYWGRLQFKISTNNLWVRCKYGSSPWSNYKQLI